jgi:exopolysaccharide biosynthesis polyprenyl glycosylphosphotransferase
VPVLVVGSVADVVKFGDTLRLNDHAGLQVAAACVTQREPVAEADSQALAASGIATLGDVDTIRDAVVQSGARSVAVVSRDISGEKLRWISWQLEGTATDLVLLPGLAEVAGRRLHIQQLGGLPLLYVAEPEFRGARRVVKAGCDRLAALAALLALAPFMLVIAALVRVTSRGPAMFLQTRVGKDGKTFRMVKFRSMCNGAQHQIVQLQAANEVVGGTLFKMRSDPRVTAVGRILRRYSLDELPQLFNVLMGSMSLVGPRPPLPAEVGSYGHDASRRLLVKPGLTGLWQISGRSDLSWDESVQLDLRYVENWSLSEDLLILWKTVRAVAHGSGAY